jgi:hypothetical protein
MDHDLMVLIVLQFMCYTCNAGVTHFLGQFEWLKIPLADVEFSLNSSFVLNYLRLSCKLVIMSFDL